MDARMAFTPDSVLLMALRIAMAEPDPVAFPRVPWVTQVLLEQIVRSPRGGVLARGAGRAVTARRGITAAGTAKLFGTLVSKDLVEPVGKGPDAAWVVVEDKVADVDAMIAQLDPADVSTLRGAAQRALAMSFAWSNTARA